VPVSGLPIGDYALLSDCRSAALVSRGGALDWLCLPRFDAASVFGRILDDACGHWEIRPADGARFTTRRRYVDGTMALASTFETGTGSVVLTDALATGPIERGHDLGAGAMHTVVRRVTGVSGSVDLRLECAPRPAYGLDAPTIDPVGGGVVFRAATATLTLSSPTPLVVDGSTVTSRFTVEPDQTVAFALQHADVASGPAPVWTQGEVLDHLDETIEAWRTWSALHQRYDGPWADLVWSSGRVLYALTYYPSGAMVAAPTTSLPEVAGGERNWDYRYAWVRDASFTLQALWVAACPHEAGKFFDYLCSAASAELDDGGELPIMFGVDGEQDLTEQVLPHLSGWRGSAPVRVGNGAWKQRQLDVYGELLDAAHRLPEVVDRLGPQTRHFLATLADIAAVRWTEPDQGIWEMRGAPRHFLYSKLMCWVALDRAVSLARELDAIERVEAWQTTREQIADAIMTQGWSEELGAFTQSFGSDTLDASCLMMSIVGFLPPEHPRLLATIDAVADQLSDERGLIYRYRDADDFDGDEGSFLLCTFWLSQAQAKAGRVKAARATFERAAAFANDLGLLSEEADATTGELLGNFPQAFSHVGLVNAAWAIAQAEAAGIDS
jgi:GH15 family glucan-1,4-alpha-glucosidase